MNPSGYYQWRSAKQRSVHSWQAATHQTFTRHAGRYGTRRMRAGLSAEGYQVGRHALQSQRTTHDQHPRTTPADPEAVVAENLLLGQPVPRQSNQAWVGDTT